MSRIALKNRIERSQPSKVISACGLSLLLLVGQTAPILGNPTGGAVVAGSATIGSAGQTLTINQSSHNAIINWQQFSIASGELTKFLVPNSSSATLNRVLGGNPSAIYGTLQSNGILYLINPNGVVVGPSGRIDTTSFLASTLDVSNSQFLSGGNMGFTGNSGASIDNEGTIHASGGDVYLIANQVANNGVLSAPQGNVGLAAGSDVLFQQAGNQHLFVQATPSGTTRAAGVTNAGTISAAAAELKAAGGNAYALAINNSGSIAATGFKKVGGQVYLTADGGNITNSGQISARTSGGNGGTIVINGHGTSASGTVLNSGSLLASGQAAGKTGGLVEILGNSVGITGNGSVDVSGDAGGGTALIGGDEHGANSAVPDADQTYLGPDATINADALTLGTGGKVILWGNQTTQVYGQISATGGAQGGNGGFVETSAASLDVLTAPDLSAPHGMQGTWLLDPSTVTITDADTSDSGFDTSPAFTITSGTPTITQSTLLAALATGNVTIDASSGSGGAGTINWTDSNGLVSTDITNISGVSTLTLRAPGSITLDDVNLAFTGGKVNFAINSSTASGPVTIENGTNLSLNGGDFTAYGTGNTSVVNGVTVTKSTIDTQGGSISLTGQSGLSGGNDSGIGVYVNSSTLESANASTEPSIGGGDVTITGNGSPGADVTAVDNLVGVFITHSVVSVVNGALSITGEVNSGLAQAVLNEDGSSSPYSGRSIGVYVDDGSAITASGTGSLLLHGDTTGSTAEISNLGVDLSSLDPTTNAIVTSIVSAAGGEAGIVITGLAGDINSSPSGTNVQTPSTSGVVVEFGAQIEAVGSAPIMIGGTGGADMNTGGTLSYENSTGISLEADNNNGATGDSQDIMVSSIGGNISMVGVAGSSVGSVSGIDIDSENGVSATVTSSAGNISLIGSVPNMGSVIQTLSGKSDGGATGVDLSGDNSSVTNINALAGSIYINGTVSSGTDNTEEAGVVFSKGTEVFASMPEGSTGPTSMGDVTIYGSTLGSTAQFLNGGVFIEGAGTLIIASGTAADSYGGTGLTITGISSTINGDSGATIDRQNGIGGIAFQPVTAGIGLVNGAEIETPDSAPITLNGTGGTNANTLNSGTGYADPVTGETSSSSGVTIFSPLASQITTITSNGSLSITGTAGSSPVDGVGVNIGGASNVGAVSITSAGGITLNGTGGPGNTSTSSALPNAGVAIIDPGNNSGTVNIQANGGNLDITGAAGTGNSTGVFMAPYFGGSAATSSTDPTLSASGSVNITSTSGLVDYGFIPTTAESVSVTTPVGTASTLNPVSVTGPLSLSGGDFNVDESFDTVTWGTVMVKNLSIEGGTNAIDLGPITATNFSFTGSGPVAINQAIDASGLVTIEDTGANITFGPGGSITDSGTAHADDVILGAGSNASSPHYIINNSTAGTNAIRVSGGNFYLYSSDPGGDAFGGITVPSGNMVFNATYATTGLPTANEELFYAAGSGNGGTNTTGGSSTTSTSTGGGSNIVPPVLTPQTTPPALPPGSLTAGLPPAPPFNFTGGGTSNQSGQTDGGLASSTGNSSQVGQNSSVVVNSGQVNNSANPQAAGALSQALGPVVYQSLADALLALGSWAAPNLPDQAGDNDGSGEQETIISGGEVVEIIKKTVKNIPADQAPQQLRNAMNGDILKGMGAGH